MSSPLQSSPEAPRRRIDPVWIWLAIFGVMAIGGTLAMSGKYAKRTDKIEAKYEGRRQAWLNRIGGEIGAGVKAQSPPGRAWPMVVAIILGAVTVLGSAVLVLFRSASDPPRDALPHDASPPDGKSSGAP